MKKWTYNTFDGGVMPLEVHNKYGLLRLQIPNHFGFAAANMLLQWHHPAGGVNTTSVFASHLAEIITFTTSLENFMNLSLVNVSCAWRLNCLWIVYVPHVDDV